jgi:membrane protease YdiL (CAAX protease family)
VRAVAKEAVVSRRLYLAVVCVFLVAYPILMPEPTADMDILFVAINVTVAALLVLWAVKLAGLSPSEVGLSRDTLGRSLLLGTLVGLIAPAIAFGLFHWPVFRQQDWWAELGMTFPTLLYRLAIRIPLGTAAFEEVAFRGVVFGLFLREGTGKTIWLSSALFGIYHIGLIVRVFDSSNIVLMQMPFAAMVVAGVVVTAIWGLIFALVRHKSGNVAGPIVTHWMAYASANVLAFIFG